MEIYLLRSSLCSLEVLNCIKTKKDVLCRDLCSKMLSSFLDCRICSSFFVLASFVYDGQEMRMQDSSSLGSLSRRFLELIEETEDGILDLRLAAEYLQVPKRRVYDVTNVLEGVDLLEKTSKNTVRWKPEETVCEEGRFFKQDIISSLETELQELEESNVKLEEEIENVLANTQKLIENEKTRELLYVTPRDVKEIASLELRKVFAFETPVDASLHRSSCPSKTPRQFCTKFLADSPTSKIRFHDVGASLISKSMENDEGSKENLRKD